MGCSGKMLGECIRQLERGEYDEDGEGFVYSGGGVGGGTAELHVHNLNFMRILRRPIPT